MKSRFTLTIALRSNFTNRKHTIMNEYLGVVLFAIVPTMLCARRTYSETRKEYNKGNIGELLASVESLVQKDQGNRGIGSIVLPAGELKKAAQTMLESRRVAIITGFPCLLKHNPPTETDGPLGALALAKCLLMLGKDVIIATDECNEEVLLACSQATMAHKTTTTRTKINTFHRNHGNRPVGKFSMESFPASTEFGAAEEKRLEELKASVDLVIAIERAGPCQDGRYLTMRGYDMTHIVAPLEMLLMPPEIMEEVDLNSEPIFTSSEEVMLIGKLASSQTMRPIQSAKVPKSIGIGDGGNEVGMGKVYPQLISSTITNAALIGCVVPTDHLLVCSVSNWGGYALAAAAAAMDIVLNTPDGCSRAQLQAHLRAYLPSEEEETAKCVAIVDAGARDGVSGELALSVDGMPLETSLEILRKLKTLELK